eukprot:CAMPEP_0183311134 /NCGR_PEP_ID=MMETSP0160_2-20130417/35325_1 /TAXON_ID=2839 ORGANISM="Odontella Sinensis, Strain Grunow 1884" /NCGR_SAMPLE_ID=MMETSP0160_2 /ASSEMBLY_ACC=CAM_ASM_000250 /LENGTH=298 /DNA_ID=CAMNT_0025475623 /DNA_START=37 /DNA_END=933 /DNA_ORIENTATION=-
MAAAARCPLVLFVLPFFIFSIILAFARIDLPSFQVLAGNTAITAVGTNKTSNADLMLKQQQSPAKSNGHLQKLNMIEMKNISLISKKISYKSGEAGITDAVIDIMNHMKSGIFVEMGANNGINSNTLKLEQNLGWNGVCIEAGPTNFQKLQLARPNCSNVNAVVADQEGHTIFREFPEGGLYGHSGIVDMRSKEAWDALIQAHKAKFVDHKVKTSTLSQIFQKQNLTHIDYFSLDVEGAEMIILQKYPFQQHPVNLWTIESNKLDRKELVNFMARKGYSCAHYDKINTFCQFVSKGGS